MGASRGCPLGWFWPNRSQSWVGALVAALLFFAGCQSLVMSTNDPLPASEASATLDDLRTLGRGGYRLNAIAANGSSPELLVFLAFSGGGKRSSAFSYGVLKGLRDFGITIDGRQRRLLDEVDAISSVSGGTFTAAYYGLHRDKLFTDYESDFLRRDIEAYIYGIYLLPWNWQWLINPFFGTNDLMQQVYDDLMFHGATYADLTRQGLPMILIGATDINYGAVFTFGQDSFDLLCSNLMTFPIARAVAASNGFPVLFTPITLENHADRCGGWRPAMVNRLKHADANDPLSRRTYLARLMEGYLNPAVTKYVHLMDGGIVDNLAMRGLVNGLVLLGGNETIIRSAGLDRVRRVVIVSVDGQAATDSAWAQLRVVPGLFQVVNAVTSTQIDQYNFETLVLARDMIDRLARTLRQMRCDRGPVFDGRPCSDVQSYFLHLSLADIPDEAVRKRLQAIPTGLTLSDQDVDLIVSSAESLVRSSPELQRLRSSLGEETGSAGAD